MIHFSGKRVNAVSKQIYVSHYLHSLSVHNEIG